MFTSNSKTHSSQGFKKKTTSSGADEDKLKPTDKLKDLRQKVEQQKQMMRNTGRRFKQDTASSSRLQSSKQVQRTQKKQEAPEPVVTKHQVCIGPDEVKKLNISLQEIGIDNCPTNETMQSSRVFEREIQEQKKRSQEMINLLESLGMESYAQPLIQNGFDDLDSLSEIKTEDMNNLMMRAPLQDRLIRTLKQRKLKTEENDQISESLSNTSTVWRTRTSDTQRRNKTSSVHLIRNMQHQSQGLKPGSFLFSVGSKNWSAEDQIRRACSVCFKVQPQLKQKGQCFYCEKCYKVVEDDVLNIQINLNFNRVYKKHGEL